MGKGARNGDHFLYKGDFQMLCKGETATAGDHRRKLNTPQLILCLLQKGSQSFLYICIMSFVIGKYEFSRCIKNGDFYSGGANVDPKTIDILIAHMKMRTSYVLMHTPMVTDLTTSSVQS